MLDANDTACLRVELAGGGLGTLTVTRWASGQVNSLSLKLYGDRGGLRLDLDRSTTDLEACLGDDLKTATWRTVPCPRTPNNFRRFVTSIRTGANDARNYYNVLSSDVVIACPGQAGTISDPGTGRPVTRAFNVSGALQPQGSGTI